MSGRQRFADRQGLDDPGLVGFVINRDRQFLNQFDQGVDDLHRPRHLNGAGLHVDDGMAVDLVESRHHVPILHADLELGLVTVAVGVRGGQGIFNPVVAVTQWLELGQCL